MSRRNRKRKSPEQIRVTRQRRWRHWVLAPVRLVLLAALGVGLGFGGYRVALFLQTSAALAVRQIEVNGTSRTRMDDLLRVAGLREGINIFSIDMERARLRLEQHPWVRSASVRRVVPDRLVLEIVEQRPVALVSLEGVYLVNPAGEIFKRFQPGEGVDLPVITGIDRSSMADDPALAQRRIVEALAMVELVDKTECLRGRQLAEVHLDEVMGTSLLLDPGALTVRLGETVSRARLEALCQLFQELEQRGLAASTILFDRADRPSWATIQLGAGRQTLDSKSTISMERI
jgi:cell division protein FtsQ